MSNTLTIAIWRRHFTVLPSLKAGGSSIHHIIEAYREQEVEDPTWRWDGGFVYVTFKRPTKLDFHSTQLQNKQAEDKKI